MFGFLVTMKRTRSCELTKTEAQTHVTHTHNGRKLVPQEMMQFLSGAFFFSADRVLVRCLATARASLLT